MAHPARGRKRQRSQCHSTSAAYCVTSACQAAFITIEPCLRHQRRIPTLRCASADPFHLCNQAPRRRRRGMCTRGRGRKRSRGRGFLLQATFWAAHPPSVVRHQHVRRLSDGRPCARRPQAEVRRHVHPRTAKGGAVGVVALLGGAPRGQMRHPMHAVAAVGPPHVAAPVATGACARRGPPSLGDAWAGLYASLPIYQCSSLSNTACAVHTLVAQLTLIKEMKMPA